MPSPDEVTCVLQARGDSPGLIDGALTTLGGRPLLAFMLARLAGIEGARMVVATSDSLDDDGVAEVARGAAVEVVRGPAADALEQVRLACMAFPARNVVRLTAACPLVDPEVVASTIALHLERSADYTCNTLPRTFPRGLDVEVITHEAIETAAAEATEPDERDHVTAFISRRPERFALANYWCPEDLGDERWAADSPQDIERLRTLIEASPGGSVGGWREILALTGRRAAPTPGVLHLRPARTQDTDLLRRWRNDLDAIRFSRTRRAVGPDEHSRWFTAQLAEPRTRTWIGMIDREPVGFVRLHVTGGEAEVSLAVARDRRRRGLARGLLSCLQEMLRGDIQVRRVAATVDPANVSSIRAFEAAGFQPSGGVDGFMRLGWDNDPLPRPGARAG